MRHTAHETLHALYRATFHPDLSIFHDASTAAYATNPMMILMYLKGPQMTATMAKSFIDNYIFSVPKNWLTQEGNLKPRRIGILRTIATDVYLHAGAEPMPDIQDIMTYTPRIRVKPLHELQYGGYFH
jgi:hypothetical protein